MVRKKWLVITAHSAIDTDAAIISQRLLELGGTAVQQSGNSFTTYIVPPDNLDSWLAAARAQLGSEVNWSWQDDQDWSESWKRGLLPRRVGRHFVIAPTWTQPELRDGDRLILIDPEMAFGTGEHATTRGALRFLESCVQPGDCVLDVGTGSAILAIGAAMCGARDVLGVEYDADAIINARDNITRNGVADVVRLDTALVDDAYLQRCGAGTFEVIAANVLSRVLLPLLPSFRVALRAGGQLILGGILEAEADEMIGAAEDSGFILRAEDLEDEWWGGLLQKPASLD